MKRANDSMLVKANIYRLIAQQHSRTHALQRFVTWRLHLQRSIISQQMLICPAIIPDGFCCSQTTFRFSRTSLTETFLLTAVTKLQENLLWWTCKSSPVIDWLEKSRRDVNTSSSSPAAAVIPPYSRHVFVCRAKQHPHTDTASKLADGPLASCEHGQLMNCKRQRTRAPWWGEEDNSAETR